MMFSDLNKNGNEGVKNWTNIPYYHRYILPMLKENYSRTQISLPTESAVKSVKTDRDHAEELRIAAALHLPFPRPTGHYKKNLQ
ncbi:hypothetical protein NPIL_657131 [Nephila pilipes]|uniref:Uncharacterized protein n=1 Tax=Nephila pilipes TaxID=299642 RepID=A0A8X6QZY7_NEPPI|nr:hypothetical protein NPIL_657131 [Nephila pilipes]